MHVSAHTCYLVAPVFVTVSGMLCLHIYDLISVLSLPQLTEKGFS